MLNKDILDSLETLRQWLKKLLFKEKESLFCTKGSKHGFSGACENCIPETQQDIELCAEIAAICDRHCFLFKKCANTYKCINNYCQGYKAEEMIILNGKTGLAGRMEGG